MGKVEHHGLLIPDKELDEHGAEEEQGEADHDRHDDAHDERLPHTVLDAINLARTVVLRDEGRGCEPEGREEGDGDAIDPSRRGEGSDRVGPEVVETHLDGDRADRNHRGLEAERKAQVQMLSQLGHRHFPVVEAHVQHGDAPPHPGDAEKHRCELRDRRSERRAGDTPVEHRHKDDHEGDVEKARNREKHERCARVPHRADNRREEVEEHERKHEQKAPEPKRRGVVDELWWGFHELKQRANENSADERHEEARGTGKNRAGRDRTPEPLDVVRAERLRDGDRETTRHAPRKTRDEEQKTHARPHRGKSEDPEVAAHDHRIDELVELLHDVADQKRHREEHDRFPRRSPQEALRL